VADPDRHTDRFDDAPGDDLPPEALDDEALPHGLDDELSDGEPSEPTRIGTSRLFRVFTALLDVHLVTARAEIRRDQARIARGLLFLVLGVTLLATVALLLQVVGVSLLMRHGFTLLGAVLVTAGADVVLGAALLALGARALRRPVLPSTRALLKRTLSSLRR
jgi:hypothetical protein